MSAAESTSTQREYKMYRVAAQLSEGAPIHIIDVKEYDQDMLLPFVCRMFEVQQAKDFAFLEIHRSRGDSIEIIYGDLKADWPKVKEIHKSGFCMRGANNSKLDIAATRPAPEPKKAEEKKVVTETAPSKWPGEKLVINRPLTLKVA